MKGAAFLALIAASSTYALNALYEGVDSAVLEKWLEFRHRFNRIYESDNEESIRFGNFLATIRRIETRQAANPEAVFGINQFSDMTPKEFKAIYLNYEPHAPLDIPVYSAARTLRGNLDTPTTWDWRNEGAVTDVKDQGGCGSCWAHSAVETVESAWAVAGNPLTEFSVQQVTSCDTTDAGCRGGDLPSAFDYIESAGGLATNAAYPYSTLTYMGITGQCQAFKTAGGDIDSYSYATTPCYSKCNTQDEATLAANLASVQPAGICVNAEPWQDYTSGVLTNANSGCTGTYSSLDHCVQLVGFNLGGTTPYWIVRNSWGTSWGVDGYIYLKYGENTCGVADEAMFVSIA